MGQLATAVKWEKVHVFISSTFNDMHAERDYLVKRVFPELQEWCERRKLRLVDIDLRWGVTEQDATHNRNAVKVCLERIDDCRPFFICFLGQRRGWVPGKDEISEETYRRFPELASHAGTASITELEILHALIKPLHNGVKYDKKKPDEKYQKVEHAFFYLRDGSYLHDIPAEPPLLRETYTNEGIDDPAERDSHDRELNQWREELAQKGRPCHSYSAEWDKLAATPEIMLPIAAPSADPGNIERWRNQWVKAGITVDGVSVEVDPLLKKLAGEFNQQLSQGRLAGFKSGVNELKDIILADLKQAISARFPDHLESLEESELQKELDQQEEFLYINSEGFIKRTGDFDDLDLYLADDSRQLFVLTAPGGMGKSMLLANWIDHAKERLGDAHTLHFRFVGQSDRSTTLPALLRSLMLELQLAGKIPKTTTEKVKDPTGNETIREVSFEIPHDRIKIQNLWNEQLAVIGRQGKTVIVIDAINQLDTGLKDLVWLPQYGLPENIKLIVSFRDDATDAQELLERFAANQKHVFLSRAKSFANLDDRRKLVNAYLTNYLKEIDDRHLEEIIALKGAENPLFLKVVLSELRVFGSFGSLTEKIRNDVGDSPVSAFNGVLHRLETDPAYSVIPPKYAVPLLFGLIAHARSGLSGEELAGMFMQTLGLAETEEHKAMALDTARLFLRQVRPFLARRDGRFDFFYESFKTTALERYVQRTTQEWHQILAEYFGELPLWEDEKERKPTKRKVAELPYHQTMGEMWAGVEKTLCDLLFIDAKCAAGQVFELQADFRLTLDNLPERQPEIQAELEREERIQRWTSEIIDYARQWNTGSGRPPLPEIIPSVEPWTEELNQEECQRVTTRLDRLNTFSDFVQAECYPLINFGKREGFVLQHAYSFAPAGPTHDAAVGLLPGYNAPLILRRWPKDAVRNPKPALLRTLEGHNSNVICVSVTPDGRRAVSGSSDNTVRVWDLESGKCLSTLEGHNSNVICVSVTPDGRRAVSGSSDATLRVWDLESGKCLSTLKMERAYIFSILRVSYAIKSLSITPDGRRAVSGSTDKRLQVWDLESGKCLSTLKGHRDEVNSVSVTPDGRRAVSGGMDGTLRVWNLDNGKRLYTLKGHSMSINSVSVTSDWRRAVSGDRDGTLRVWNLDSGNCLRSLKGHNGYVSTVCVTPDGRRAVSGGGDNTLRVWNLDSGKCISTLEGHNDDVESVCLTPDGRRAVSGSLDKTVRLWDLERGKCPGTLEGHGGCVSSVSVTPDGRWAVSGGKDGTLLVWNLDNGMRLNTLKGHSGPIKGVSVTPDGRRAVSWSTDHTLRVWDLEGGKCLCTLEGHNNRINCVSLTPDGRRAVSGGEDAMLRVWDLESGENIRILINSSSRIKSVSLTPDGRRAVSGGGIFFWDPDYTLRVWDLESGKCLSTLEGHNSNVICVRVTPDGRRAVSGSLDKTVRVWDLESGICLRTLRGHESPNDNSVSLTPDGRRAVLMEADSTLRVWDLESRKCLSTLKGHNDYVSSVRVTPDGRRAVSGSLDKTVRVWDLESGICLWAFISAAPISELALFFNLVLTVTESGEVLFLELKNLTIDRPVITARRLWLFGQKAWDDNLTASCPWCGVRFNADSFFDTVSPGFIMRLQGARRTYVLKSSEINCPMPGCSKPLKLNPFVCDNS